MLLIFYIWQMTDCIIQRVGIFDPTSNQTKLIFNFYHYLYIVYYFPLFYIVYMNLYTLSDGHTQGERSII